MKRLSLILALALIAGACGSDSESTDTTSGGADSTTTTVAATTTSTTLGVTPTTATPSDEAEFAISRVVFGDDGYVSITNVGGAAGNLEGWQLCQRPAYYAIGSVEVAPGETVHFTIGDASSLAGQVIDSGGRFGSFGADSGEIGLYVDGSFGSPSSIRSYVEWGESDHGRSSVAVEAGIWDGRFVASSGAPGIAAVVANPIGAADWATS